MTLAALNGKIDDCYSVINHNSDFDDRSDISSCKSVKQISNKKSIRGNNMSASGAINARIAHDLHRREVKSHSEHQGKNQSTGETKGLFDMVSRASTCSLIVSPETLSNGYSSENLEQVQIPSLSSLSERTHFTGVDASSLEFDGKKQDASSLEFDGKKQDAAVSKAKVSPDSEIKNSHVDGSNGSVGTKKILGDTTYKIVTKVISKLFEGIGSYSNPRLKKARRLVLSMFISKTDVENCKAKQMERIKAKQKEQKIRNCVSNFCATVDLNFSKAKRVPVEKNIGVVPGFSKMYNTRFDGECPAYIPKFTIPQEKPIRPKREGGWVSMKRKNLFKAAFGSMVNSEALNEGNFLSKENRKLRDESLKHHEQRVAKLVDHERILSKEDALVAKGTIAFPKAKLEKEKAKKIEEYLGDIEETM